MRESNQGLEETAVLAALHDSPSSLPFARQILPRTHFLGWAHLGAERRWWLCLTGRFPNAKFVVGAEIWVWTQEEKELRKEDRVWAWLSPSRKTSRPFPRRMKCRKKRKKKTWSLFLDDLFRSWRRSERGPRHVWQSGAREEDKMKAKPRGPPAPLPPPPPLGPLPVPRQEEGLAMTNMSRRIKLTLEFVY